MANPVSAPSGEMPSTALSSFLKIANEYKEFVALVVFVIGGIFWAFDYFATKEQVKVLHCILNENMTFVQGKMDSASLSQLMLDNIKESAALDNKRTLSADEGVKRNQLKTGAAEIARKLADAQTATAKAMSKLTSGNCIAD